MTHRLFVRDEVWRDLNEIKGWYENRSPGLGMRFALNLDAEFSFISHQPLASPMYYKTLRRSFMKRFPYADFYLVEGETVTILALVHQSMGPKLTRQKLKR
ncbi:MAG: type II toxin-antitoxin system RelE/ParE family toxin [Spirochaetia bacterium]|nr:type II toxin-antitoxin system RelE/ParE family toxin [Spirochaetia bacterium]